MHNTWLAAHFYSPEPLNSVLTGLVIPVINRFGERLEQPTPYFFIRYWQGGSHVRLRLNVTISNIELIKNAIKLDVALFNKNNAPVESHPPGNGIKALLKFEPYLPETERYGNAKSLPLAEHLFYLSSEYILRWINENKSGASTLIESIRMHLIFLCATCQDTRQMEALCTSFINGWIMRLYHSFKQESEQRNLYLNAFNEAFSRTKDSILPVFKLFWKQLATGTADNRATTYLNACKKIAKQYHSMGFSEDKMRGILGSIIHMTNNRLGVSNHEEAYGMFCTLQCLNYIVKGTDI